MVLVSQGAEFEELLSYLQCLPAVEAPIGHGASSDGSWWVKLVLSLTHPLAWNVVQELAHVLNLLSLDERLPTVFKPVSPAPYLNGGPQESLSWVIESQAPFTPTDCREWLEGRLPRPVHDEEQWTT